jgi:hypothetical protein
MSDIPETWNKIREAMDRDVSDFNSKGKSQITFSGKAEKVIQVLPPPPGITPVVVQITGNDGNREVYFYQGTDKSEMPRWDYFTINREGLIVLKQRGTGQPEPSKEPMTAEQFSKYVLIKLAA